LHPERVDEIILADFGRLRSYLNEWSPKVSAEAEGWGVSSLEELEQWAEKFETKLRAGKVNAGNKGTSSKTAGLSIFERLRSEFLNNGGRGLVGEMKYTFASFIIESRFSAEDIRNQEYLADLRYPLEWFPATRAMQREIHLHVGPTNSGKTYHALKRLEAAESGIYAGPLRLLAHEVYTRLQAKGKKCALITGEERRIPEDCEFIMNSCTVEMVPLNANVEVAVIDEIQMMGNAERGWAWTQAFLGVMAKEVHLCGELRTIPLIQDLCAATGDSLKIHRYERLSPLEAMDKSLNGDLSKLEKGDAIIVFTRLGIHAMKREIERKTGKRCAVIYGSLPPETRAQQANLFNDPNNEYDYLVASDAVGMGLNLSIKRIVFEATSKSDGKTQRTLEISDIKQIGGRAGRYKSAAQAITNDDGSNTEGPAADKTITQLQSPKNATTTVGLVTALEDFDMKVVKKAMATDVEPLKTAGIFPPATILARFAAYFPSSTPFSYILLRLHQICSVHPRYHLCSYKDQIAIADVIQPFAMTINDRMTFINAPANLRDENMIRVVQAFAKCIADQSGGELLDIGAINLELIDRDGHGKEFLYSLEALHKALTLYLWLSYRFAGIFRSQHLAFHVKELLEAKIDKHLGEVELTKEERQRQVKARQRAVSDDLEEASDSSEAVSHSELLNVDVLNSETMQGQQNLASFKL